MPRKSKAPNPHQTELPLERDRHRLAAIKSLTPELLGLGGGRSWSNLIDLLEQIELCTGRDGCFAYTETLTARMNGGRGVSRATFFRTAKLAKELHLLTGAQRTNSRGAKQSNLWRVNWEKIMILAHPQLPKTRNSQSETLVPPSETLAKKSETLAKKSETTWSQTETTPSQTETLLIRNNSSLTSLYNGSTVDVDQTEKSGERGASRLPPANTWPAAETAAVREVANRVVAKLGRCRSAADRDLVAKAAYLAGRAYSEHWLWDAVEACLRRQPPPKNRWSYFYTCLAEGAQREGTKLTRSLARVTVPAELLARSSTTDVDLTDRLCTTGREP